MGKSIEQFQKEVADQQNTFNNLPIGTAITLRESEDRYDEDAPPPYVTRTDSTYGAVEQYYEADKTYYVMSQPFIITKDNGTYILFESNLLKRMCIELKNNSLSDVIYIVNNESYDFTGTVFGYTIAS